VAIYFVDMNVVRQPQSIDTDTASRTAAIDAYNYIARCHQYSKRNDLLYLHSGNMPSWTCPGKHSSLWNAVDTYERKNARCALHLRIALPREATDAERIKLAKAIAADICAQGQPYTLAIHLDEINPHVHILIYERLGDGVHRDKVQYFRRAAPAGRPAHLGGARKFETKKAWIYEMREKVEKNINSFLVPRGIEPVSRLSYWARGIDKRAQRKLSGAIRKTIDRFSLKYDVPQSELRRVWVEWQCKDRDELELYAINYGTEQAIAAEAAQVEAEQRAKTEREAAIWQRAREDQDRQMREAAAKPKPEPPRQTPPKPKPEPPTVKPRVEPEPDPAPAAETTYAPPPAPILDSIPLVVMPPPMPPPEPTTRAEFRQAIINAKAQIAGLKAVINEEQPAYNKAKHNAEVTYLRPVEEIRAELDQAKADLAAGQAELARLTAAAAKGLKLLPAGVRAKFESGELHAGTGDFKALRSGAGYGKPWAHMLTLKAIRKQERAISDLQAVFDEVASRFKVEDDKLARAVRSMRRHEEILIPYQGCLAREKESLARATAALGRLEAEYQAKYDLELAAIRNTPTEELLTIQDGWAELYQTNPPGPDDLDHVEMIELVLGERAQAAAEDDGEDEGGEGHGGGPVAPQHGSSRPKPSGGGGGQRM